MTDAERLIAEAQELRRKAAELIEATKRAKADHAAEVRAVERLPTPPPDEPPPDTNG